MTLIPTSLYIKVKRVKKRSFA